MIEVEQKFTLSPEQEISLLEGAVLDYKKVNVDEFFDLPDWKLSLQDVWLRKRNGNWELKVGRRLKEGLATVYDELESDDLIASWLNLPGEHLEKEITGAGYACYARIEKSRRSYTREGFRIDIDLCDFGYGNTEIELLVEQGQEAEAQDRIAVFAKRIGLTSEPVQGKVIEYIRRFNPDHYQALHSAGILH